MRKTVKKADNVRTGGGGGLPQFIHFSLILPGPQITWKWTLHTDKFTTKCHLRAHLQEVWLNVQDLELIIHDSEGSQ